MHTDIGEDAAGTESVWPDLVAGMNQMADNKWFLFSAGMFSTLTQVTIYGIINLNDKYLLWIGVRCCI